MSQMRKPTRHELEAENAKLRASINNIIRVLSEEREMLKRHGPDAAFDAFKKYLCDAINAASKKRT